MPTLRNFPTSALEPTTYEVQVGDRGRLVLPAPARRLLGIEQGSRLLLRVEETGVVTLTSAKAAAERCMGILRASSPDRSMTDELIAERREAARNE